MIISVFISFLLILYFFLLDIRKTSFHLALFKPTTIINVYLLIFFIIPLGLGSFFYNDYLEGIDFTKHFTRISWIITFLILFFRIIDRASFKENIQSNIKVISKLRFSLTMSVIIFIVIISGLIVPSLIQSFLNGNLSEFSMGLRNGSALKFFLLASFEAIPLLVLIYSKRINKLFLSLLVIICFLAIVLLGARALILTLFLSFILFYLSERKLKSKFLIFAGLLFLAVFSFASLNRAGENDLLGYLSRNLDQLTNTAVVIEKIETGQVNYQYGATFIDVIYFFIPTSVWPNKPRSYLPSRLIYPQMIDDGISSGTKFTMNFGLIGRSYLEGGILGVFLISTIVVVFFNSLYKKIISNSFKSLKEKFICIYVFAHIHQVIIIGPTSHVYGIYLISITLLLLVITIANTIFKIRHNYLA